MKKKQQTNGQILVLGLHGFKNKDLQNIIYKSLRVEFHADQLFDKRLGCENQEKKYMSKSGPKCFQSKEREGLKKITATGALCY